MNLEDAIRKRKSVRVFKDTDVSDEVVEKMLSLARLAPSAGAIRGYRTVVTRRQLVHVKAPIYLVVCANSSAYSQRYGERGENLYSIQDATILGAYFQLILVDNGLASVWIGAFREGKIKRTLELEECLRPIAIIAFGYV